MKKTFPPDTRHEPVFQNELTIEVTYTPKKLRRAVITRDSNDRFRVRRERWDIGDADFTGEGHWLPDGRGLTIAATLETARDLAEEKLKEAPDG